MKNKISIYTVILIQTYLYLNCTFQKKYCHKDGKGNRIHCENKECFLYQLILNKKNKGEGFFCNEGNILNQWRINHEPEYKRYKSKDLSILQEIKLILDTNSQWKFCKKDLNNITLQNKKNNKTSKLYNHCLTEKDIENMILILDLFKYDLNNIESKIIYIYNDSKLLKLQNLISQENYLSCFIKYKPRIVYIPYKFLKYLMTKQIKQFLRFNSKIKSENKIMENIVKTIWTNMHEKQYFESKQIKKIKKEVDTLLINYDYSKNYHKCTCDLLKKFLEYELIYFYLDRWYDHKWYLNDIGCSKKSLTKKYISIEFSKFCRLKLKLEFDYYTQKEKQGLYYLLRFFNFCNFFSKKISLFDAIDLALQFSHNIYYFEFLNLRKFFISLCSIKENCRNFEISKSTHNMLLCIQKQKFEDFFKIVNRRKILKNKNQIKKKIIDLVKIMDIFYQEIEDCSQPRDNDYKKQLLKILYRQANKEKLYNRYSDLVVNGYIRENFYKIIERDISNIIINYNLYIYKNKIDQSILIQNKNLLNKYHSFL